MHSYLEISASALLHNYRVFCRLAGKKRIVPVLKSNAYGHGLAEVYGALAKANIPWLCTNYVEEAAQLRKLGYKGRIMVTGPVPKQEFTEAARLKAEIFIRDHYSLDAWLKSKSRPEIHVKFDTGMNRQGFVAGDETNVAAKLARVSKEVAGLCTHFANVEDVLEHTYADQQLARFENARKAFKKAKLNPFCHTAASAAVLLLEDSWFDLCRVGISLYGQWPSPSTRLSFLQMHGEVVELRPALSWRTWVATLKDVRAGDYIGYGCTYRAVTKMRVAVLPVGYFEGFPRLAGSEQSYVLIKGARCKVVGRICMNMMMVDVTHLPHVQVMDPVTLIGEDGSEVLHAGDVAAWAQTIHYELLSRLNPAIERRVIK